LFPFENNECSHTFCFIIIAISGVLSWLTSQLPVPRLAYRDRGGVALRQLSSSLIMAEKVSNRGWTRGPPKKSGRSSRPFFSTFSVRCCTIFLRVKNSSLVFRLRGRRGAMIAITPLMMVDVRAKNRASRSGKPVMNIWAMDLMKGSWRIALR